MIPNSLKSWFENNGRLVFAFAGALLVLNLLAFAFGQAPADNLARAFRGTWGTPYGMGQVLFKATPLLMTGLAFHVALRAGLFNIGTEGQLALGCLVGAYIGARLPDGTSALIALPVVIGSSLAVGAGYAFIAGYMRARLGVHEIISGIMLNRCVDVGSFIKDRTANVNGTQDHTARLVGGSGMGMISQVSLASVSAV